MEHPLGSTLCSEPVILPQDEVDQRYAGSSCSSHKLRRKVVLAHKTWILYPESKHDCLLSKEQ